MGPASRFYYNDRQNLGLQGHRQAHDPVNGLHTQPCGKNK